MHLRTILTSTILVATVGSASAQDWPQWRGENRDGVWTDENAKREFEPGELTTVWRQPIKAGYSGPTVANGRVFLMDRVVEPKQIERVLCFEEATGKPLWVREYDATYVKVGYVAGPRASVTVDGDLVYSLGTMGNLMCLSAAEGRAEWTSDLNKRYKILENDRMPIWGIAASPLIHGDLVIVHCGGSEGACIVALDKLTGEERWRASDDRGQYSAPIIHTFGETEVLICWTGDHVAGLNPVTGEIHWEVPMTPRNMPIGVATPIVKDNHVFVTSFYDGSMMIRVSDDGLTAEKAWAAIGENERSTRALHSIISTPVWIGEHIYGVDSYGEFRCLKAEDGSRAWSDDEAAVPRARWSTVHFVQNGEDTWMFNERGELIVGRLSPDGFEEVSRAKLIEPTKPQLPRRGGVCWSHPAFANGKVFLRNDEELICVDLTDDK